MTRQSTTETDSVPAWAVIIRRRDVKGTALKVGLGAEGV